MPQKMTKILAKIAKFLKQFDEEWYKIECSRKRKDTQVNWNLQRPLMGLFN